MKRHCQKYCYQVSGDSLGHITTNIQYLHANHDERMCYCSSNLQLPKDQMLMLKARHNLEQCNAGNVCPWKTIDDPG